MLMDTDLYYLNFKQVLVILSANDMRANILESIKDNEIDANFVFVDSYFKAANLINEQKFDPFDYIILNTTNSNSKLKDFMEFLAPNIEAQPDLIVEYTQIKSSKEHEYYLCSEFFSKGFLRHK